MIWNWPRINADARIISTKLRPNLRVLDIGAVPPLLAGLLRQSGFNEITVADPNASDFKEYFRKDQIKFLDLDVLNDFDNNLVKNFDLVCLNEVIEHLSGNLLHVLDRVVSCLDENGYLYLTTPNLRSLSGLAAIVLFNSGLGSKPYETVRQQYERCQNDNGYYGHLREFTPKEVVQLVESFGLELISIEYQANYLRQSRTHRVVGMLEAVVPNSGLFAKYLFKKTDKSPVRS